MHLLFLYTKPVLSKEEYNHARHTRKDTFRYNQSNYPTVILMEVMRWSDATCSIMPIAYFPKIGYLKVSAQVHYILFKLIQVLLRIDYCWFAFHELMWNGATTYVVLSYKDNVK